MGDLGRRATYIAAVRNALAFTQRDIFGQIAVVEQLQVRFDRLQNNFERFEEQHNLLIEGEVDDDLIRLHQQLYDEIEQDYYTAHANFRVRINALHAEAGIVPENEANRPQAVRLPGENRQEGHGNIEEPFRGFDIRNVPGLGVLPERPLQGEPMEIEQQQPPAHHEPQFIVHIPPIPPLEAVPPPPPLPPVAQQVQQPQMQLQRIDDQQIDITKINDTWGSFDGNRLQWQSFRDRFNVSVHQNARIDAVYKFQLLLKAVTGAAAKVIGSWQLTAANYESAWTKLNQVYDDEYLIRYDLLNRLFSMPQVMQASETAFRDLIDTTHEVVRQLMALNGVNEHQWDAFLVFMLVSRLDADTASRWELARTNSNPSIEELTEFLERQAKALSRTTDVAKPRAHDRRSNARRPNDDSRHSSLNRTNVGASTSQQQEPRATKCCYCGAGHMLYKCNDFLKLGLRTRRTVVKQNNLCQNCFKRGHSHNTCYGGACVRCPGSVKHNSSICPTTELNVRTNATKKDEKSNKPTKRKGSKDKKDEENGGNE